MKKIMSPISTHKELVLQLALLRNEKMEKELVLSTSIKEIIHSADQKINIKNIIREIADDTEIKRNLLKIGLNLGTKFLLKKFLPREEQHKASPRPENYFSALMSLFV